MLRPAMAVLLLILGSCYQRGGSLGLSVESFAQGNRLDLRLNEHLELVFSDELYAGSVSRESLVIQDDRGHDAQGEVRVEGRRITFDPYLPNRPDLMDGGLLPGTTYTIRLAGGLQATAIESRNERRLARSYVFTVRTVAADAPEVFGAEPSSPVRAFATVPEIGSPLPGAFGGKVRAGDPFRIWFDGNLDPRTVTREAFHVSVIPAGGGDKVAYPILGVTLRQEGAGAWVTIQPTAEQPVQVDDTYAIEPEQVRDLSGLPVDTKWIDFTGVPKVER